MSWADYQISKDLMLSDPPFAALIMAAYRKADTQNAQLLSALFPGIVVELDERYNAQGGLIDGDPEELRKMVLGG